MLNSPLQFARPREGGDPVARSEASLDSRLRGNERKSVLRHELPRAQRRPNNLSSSQESSPPDSFDRLFGWLATSAGGEGAAAGAGKLNQPLSPRPGSAVGAVPASAARMKRLQISTGTPPPTARLVGLLSSLPSQMPATRREV